MALTSFSIVLPMYNEEKNVEKCVTLLNSFLDTLPNKTIIIAVDDGSTDQTLTKLKEVAPQFSRLRIESHPANKGYGGANISGGIRSFNEKMDYALFMDADLTQNFASIHDFIKEMEKGVDCIKATRYSKGGRVIGVPWQRRIVSWVGNKIAKASMRLPIRDYTNGYRAIKTPLLMQIHCRERGFAYLIEELRELSKITNSFSEVPYTLTTREAEFSPSKFNYNFRIYYKYLRNLF